MRVFWRPRQSRIGQSPPRRRQRHCWLRTNDHADAQIIATLPRKPRKYSAPVFAAEARLRFGLGLPCFAFVTILGVPTTWRCARTREEARAPGSAFDLVARHLASTNARPMPLMHWRG